MKLLMPIAASLFLAAPAVGHDTVLSYEASLDFYDMQGEQKAVYKLVMPVEIVENAARDASSAQQPGALLIGNLQQDAATGRIASNLTICAPEGDACEAMATPDLSFAAGESATFHVAGPQFSVTLTLSPVSGVAS